MLAFCSVPNEFGLDRWLLAGELAAAGWDPDAGFARYEARMRSLVEASQEIGRLSARSRDVPGPGAEPSPDFASEWFTELVGRAINGIELPDYAGVPGSAAPAGSPVTSPARPQVSHNVPRGTTLRQDTAGRPPLMPLSGHAGERQPGREPEALHAPAADAVACPTWPMRPTLHRRPPRT